MYIPPSKMYNKGPQKMYMYTPAMYNVVHEPSAQR
jgi:hypothetical protein